MLRRAAVMSSRLAESIKERTGVGRKRGCTSPETASRVHTPKNATAPATDSRVSWPREGSAALMLCAMAWRDARSSRALPSWRRRSGRMACTQYCFFIQLLNLNTVTASEGIAMLYELASGPDGAHGAYIHGVAATRAISRSEQNALGQLTGVPIVGDAFSRDKRCWTPVLHLSVSWLAILQIGHPGRQRWRKELSYRR